MTDNRDPNEPDWYSETLKHDPRYDPNDEMQNANGIVRKILSLGQPVTRENWIGHYRAMDPDPKRPWTADDEDQVPSFLSLE